MASVNQDVPDEALMIQQVFMSLLVLDSLGALELPDCASEILLILGNVPNYFFLVFSAKNCDMSDNDLDPGKNPQSCYIFSLPVCCRLYLQPLPKVLGTPFNEST